MGEYDHGSYGNRKFCWGTLHGGCKCPACGEMMGELHDILGAGWGLGTELECEHCHTELEVEDLRIELQIIERGE